MKKIIIGGIIFLAIASFLVTTFFFQGAQTETQEPLGSSNGKTSRTSGEQASTKEDFVVPTFSEIALDVPHTYDKSSYAFRGSALIDIDNDGVDELWLAGGKGEKDRLLAFVDGAFSDITESSGLLHAASTAGGALSIDVDNDRDVDLVVAREDGIYMYINTDGSFAEQKIDVTFSGAVVPFSVSASDYNKDGFVDFYISTFIAFDRFQSATFNKQSNRSPNMMLRGNSDGTFTDVTEASGLSFDHNTFQVSFVDFDNDTWADLVIAPNTSEIYIYKNNGDGTFSAREPLGNFGFWMGLAVADIDNDGDQDFFMSNVGETIPERVGRGDLREDQVLDRDWRLFRNDGDFNFTDITKDRGITDQKFGWGAAFGDINNDGLQELAVSENYIKWPAHKLKKLPGSLFVQKEGSLHRQISALNVENPFYGTTPLFTDLSNDGHPEMLYINMDSTTRAFKNNATNNHYIKVALPDTAEYLGAHVKVYLESGEVRTQQKIVGQGLMSDGSADMIFGIGSDSSVKKVEILRHTGEIQTIESPQINTRIEL